MSIPALVLAFKSSDSDFSPIFYIIFINFFNFMKKEISKKETNFSFVELIELLDELEKAPKTKPRYTPTGDRMYKNWNGDWIVL